jgi:DNA-directed RNA polymerase subunit N (RpoN/RPB10)
MSNSNKPKIPGRCPKCGSANIQGEPLYPYEDLFEEDYPAEDDQGDLAVFCVSCGHYLGEMQSELTGRLQDFQQKLRGQFSGF